ncbi:Ribosome biogenesis GTPase A [Sporotomaculum syntrophicum]|uniref:Ribosome biogenesis GTPase A n=1 Tax=Sporotomaculum syntrophicum TaxID=182264 RepID=A0A9D2WS62_9FIRM|nr:ribosome biogenesis GTPase YlqF [Sporotomaculum syntrophicum]KAF1086642.1 Ribosome biogenesis GTPase A [Sporotomaculum syntrophicum]
MDIQWYPGHMAKARKQVQQNLQMVDVVIELLDARIPASSRNPDINVILKDKPRLVVLNKSDLAAPEATAAWLDYFNRNALPAVAVDAHHGAGIKKMIALTEQQARPAVQKYMSRGRLARLARCMVVGVPNVGKSMLINKLAGKKVARTGNRPGVTRGEQWIKLGSKLELLDTPGILWPKFEDPETAYKLSVTGAIKEQIYNPEEICLKLVQWLLEKAPDVLASRYKLDTIPGEIWEVIEKIGKYRGFYLSGGKIDSNKAAVFVIKEFREGRLGKFSLELP